MVLHESGTISGSIREYPGAPVKFVLVDSNGVTGMLGGRGGGRGVDEFLAPSQKPPVNPASHLAKLFKVPIPRYLFPPAFPSMNMTRLH